MPEVETVKVKADNEQGFIVINKTDLNDTHKLFSAKSDDQTQKTAPAKRGKS